MTANTFQKSPYLPRQRNFPVERLQELGIQLDNSYIEIASRVNERTIGTFGTGFQIITGENWYLKGQRNKQQTLRQVYQFTSTADIPHGIIFSQISGFTRCWGQYTDGTNWYGLIFGSNSATTIPGQISFFIKASPGVIRFKVDGAAPALTSGTIILEWLSVVDTNS